MRPIQADRSIHDTTPMGWRGTQSMDDYLKAGHSNKSTQLHNAVEAAVQHDASRQQKTSDLVGQGVVRRPPRPGLRGLRGSEVNPRQAQAALENGADQLAMRARQYQAFLTGGAPQRMGNFGRMAGQTGNATQRMLGAGVPLNIRG